MQPWWNKWRFSKKKKKSFRLTFKQYCIKCLLKYPKIYTVGHLVDLCQAQIPWTPHKTAIGYTSIKNNTERGVWFSQKILGFCLNGVCLWFQILLCISESFYCAWPSNTPSTLYNSLIFICYLLSLDSHMYLACLYQTPSFKMNSTYFSDASILDIDMCCSCCGDERNLSKE